MRLCLPPIHRRVRSPPPWRGVRPLKIDHLFCKSFPDPRGGCANQLAFEKTAGDLISFADREAPSYQENFLGTTRQQAAARIVGGLGTPNDMNRPEMFAFVQRLSARPRAFHQSVTVVGFLLVTVVDWWFDPALSVLSLYLVPIIYALWFLGASYGQGLIGAALVSLAAQDIVETARFGRPVMIPYWNLLTNLGLFGVVVWIIALFKGAMEHDREMEAQRAQREMDVAREVQLRLLPVHVPFTGGVEVGFAYQAAQAVGGDYYDFFPLGEGRFGMAVGDVSGKGLAAALLMATLQGLIRTSFPHRPSELSAFMGNLNRTLYSLTDPNKYATLFFALYDCYSSELHYVNAGHNQPFLVQQADGSPRISGAQFAAGGPPVGLLPQAVYQTDSVTLAPGDLLIVYTDGVVDAENPKEEQFGEQRLKETLKDACGRPVAMVCGDVVEAVKGFASTAKQFDDITLVALRATAPSASTVRHKVASHRVEHAGDPEGVLAGR